MQGYDIIEDMYSPKTSATNFVHELCTHRAKEFLPPLLQLVTAQFGVLAVRDWPDAGFTSHKWALRMLKYKVVVGGGGVLAGPGT